MKKALAFLCPLFISSAAISQKLIVEPQIGVRTFQYLSNPNYPSPSRFLPSPSAGARLIYLSRKGHGPYIGFHTNSLIVNDHAGTTSYTGNINLFTYEAGYQWMSKPIYFKHIWDNHISRADFERISNKGLAVQIMPGLGVSYIKSSEAALYRNFALKNSTLGLNAGVGFAFSKNARPLFNLNFNYTRGIANLYDRNIPGPGYLSTKASGFNITLGVPITLFRKK